MQGDGETRRAGSGPGNDPGPPNAPGATLTLLFTDIEGSTRLIQRSAEAYAGSLEAHRAVVFDAARTDHGRVVDTQGDAFFLVFARAADAVAAAAAIQTATEAHAWPKDGRLRVRIGLHTGEPAAVGSGYVGVDVNRAARIAGAAHGGQILMSAATRALVEQNLPETFTLLDLGEHRLKDLNRPQHLSQLVVPGLQKEFPPPRTLTGRRHNLPLQISNFIGRVDARDDVTRLAADSRLVTLVGPGGTGKTRLALEVGANLLDTETCADGVWLVELAPVTDPARLPHAIAAAVGVHEETGSEMTATLVSHLRDWRCLVILDNCEHLIEAAARCVDELLRACSGVHILVTAREGLGITGERLWRVPSLSVPAAADASIEEIGRSESVLLFIDRARTVRAEFALTEVNAAAVAEVCRRLDGIPLAIELAGSRVRTLSVEQIRDRLDDRFRLLTGGSRTALPRQQTLRALIDWSFDLLTPEERLLFQRLSVFSGGWTLEAAEAVAAGGAAAPGGQGAAGEGVTGTEGTAGGAAGASGAMGSSSAAELSRGDVLPLLSNLIDKSLAIMDDRSASTRYRFLETIRQYALDRLLESGDVARVRELHLNYFVRFAEEADTKIRGAEQARWLTLLDDDHENLRTALDWSAGSGDTVGHLRLASALWRYWRVRSLFSEGRAALESALGREVDVPPPLRAKALQRAGSLASYQADYRRAEHHLRESLALDRRAAGEHEIGDDARVGDTLNILANATMMQGRFDEANELLEESLGIATRHGDRRAVAYARFFLGTLAIARDDLTAARPHFETSLALLRELDDAWWVSNTLLEIAWIDARRAGDQQKARSSLEAMCEEFRDMDDRRGASRAMVYVGEAELAAGEAVSALERFRQALVMCREIGDVWRVIVCIECIGCALAALGEPVGARALLDAAERLHADIGAPAWPARRADVAETRTRLDAETAGERRTGMGAASPGISKLTMEQAVNLALNAPIIQSR
jgi:predicted ATPase/class 3 adenylate cyclase